MTKTFEEIKYIMKGVKLITDSTIEDASKIFKKVKNKGIGKTCNSEIFNAVIIYCAVRINDIPLTLSEILEINSLFPDSERFFFKLYKKVKKELNLNIPLIKPESFVPRICSNLNLTDPYIETYSYLIFEKSKKRGLNDGKNPIAFILACVYISCLLRNCRKSQREMVSACGYIISESSIRKNYKKILEELGLYNEFKN